MLHGHKSQDELDLSIRLQKPYYTQHSETGSVLSSIQYQGKEGKLGR